MKHGTYYIANQERLSSVQEKEWVIAIKKCKEHISWKLKQKTLYGAHTDANLGEDPYDFYLKYAYESIISGIWEWKSQFTLVKQLIRIINSKISWEVKKYTNAQEEEAIASIKYVDIEKDLYFIGVDPEGIAEDVERKFENQVDNVKSAIEGSSDLEFFWACIGEGKSRSEIADLMELTPRQLDKIREKFIRTVKSNKEKA